MKKFLIASGVAVLAFASIAGAQGTAFNTNLTVGSTGSDVVALQTWLIANGYSIPSIASGAAAKGYFGSQTKAAVQAYQTAKGIPSTGFVGPLTRGALNAGGAVVTPAPVGCPVGMICTPVGGGAPVVSTGGLAGTDGTISDVNELSSYSNEEVGDGQNDVKVLGMEVEASNDGDIALKSIKVSFDSTGNGGSDNLDDYIESVSVWMGSTKVGSADVSSFNEDSGNIWSKTITLNNAVVRADKTEKFYVAVDSVSNLDSGDISGDSWTVDVDSIRFEDGSGVVTSDTTTGDIDGMDVAIEFVSFSSAADTELKISTDTSASPEADMVAVDESDNTDNVPLLVGKFKLEGTSDAVIDEIPVTLTVTGATDVDAVTGSVTLVLDGEEYTESVSTNSVTSATITFDNLDFDLAAGKTITFKVLADINDIETGTFDEGDTLTASLTSTNRDYMDVENEEGDQLSDSSEKSGTATGEAQEFRTNGVVLNLLSTSATVSDGASANTDTGTFEIKFGVKAIGDTIYVASTSAYIFKGSVATTSNSMSLILENDSDSEETANGNFLIEEGDVENFTMTVTVPLLGNSSSTGSYQVRLAGLGWDTADNAVATQQYTSNLDDFKTKYISLN